MIIGIDLSSTISGLALSENKIIFDATALDISMETSYDGKANIIIKHIDGWLLSHKNITDINIEGALNAFAFGKTNALTLIKLIKVNAVVTYILQKQYPNIKFNSLNMLSARKWVFGKARVKGIKPKFFVKMMIEKTNPEIMKFYLPKKSVRCKNENSMNEDIRDAAVMSLFIG